LVNKNVLSFLLKDGREVDAVTLVGRLFHAHGLVTRNDRSPVVLSRVRGTIRHGQELDVATLTSKHRFTQCFMFRFEDFVWHLLCKYVIKRIQTEFHVILL